MQQDRSYPEPSPSPMVILCSTTVRQWPRHNRDVTGLKLMFFYSRRMKKQTVKCQIGKSKLCSWQQFGSQTKPGSFAELHILLWIWGSTAYIRCLEKHTNFWNANIPTAVAGVDPGERLETNIKLPSPLWRLHSSALFLYRTLLRCFT